MIKIQQHTVDLELNSPYESAIFNLNVSPNTSISITGGTLVVNGIDVPSPTIINPTSNIQVKLTTPLTYVTTSYAIINTGVDNYVISCTTKTDPTQTHLPGSINVSPFDYLTHPNGYTVTPYSSSNRLSKLKSDNTVENLVLSNIQTNDFYPTDIKDHSFVFSCNFFTDSLYLLDTTLPLETSLVGKITLDEGARPTGGITDHVTNYLYIAQSGLNSILIIDRPTGTIIDTIVVGNKPMSIIQDSQHRIWVANYDSNTVSLIVDDVVTNTINVGTGPLELALDSTENVWVTNSKTNTVSRIDSITLDVTTVVVGTNPWGICLFDGNIIVANSYSDTLSVINTTTSNVINTINVSSTPYSLSNTSSILYVACYSNSVIEQYSTTFTKLNSTAVNKYPYDIQIDNTNNIWIMEYYSNIPSRTVDIDQNAIQVSFLHINNAYISTNYISNEITIAGIYSNVPASIPAINGHSLYKNNINVGFSTTVTNGDILKISTTSSAQYSDTTTIQLTIGNIIADYNITTEPYNLIVDSFIFEPVLNATLNTQYPSNIITISGLSHNITVPMTISNGTIIKNGSSVGNSTNVKNDDTVQILLTSSTINNTPIFSTVNIGGVIGIFSVLTTGTNIFNIVPDLTFDELIDQPTNILETSNEIIISGLPIFVPPDPQTEPPTEAPIYTLQIDPYPNTIILKNGINSGTSTTINNGDNISIQTYSSIYNGFKSQVNLYVGNIISTWNITTTYNPPLPFIFQDQYNIVPRDTVLSNNVIVSKLDPNKITEVFLPYGRLIINGTPSTDNIIQNGDNVRWEVSAKGPYGGVRTYKLSVGGTSLQTGVISTWKIGTRSLQYSAYFEDINKVHTNSLPASFSKSASTATNISIDTNVLFTRSIGTNVSINTNLVQTTSTATNVSIDTNVLFTRSTGTDISIDTNLVQTTSTATNVSIDTNVLFTHSTSTNVSIDTNVLFTRSTGTDVSIDTNVLFTHSTSTNVSIDTNVLFTRSTGTDVSIDTNVLFTHSTSTNVSIDTTYITSRNIELPVDVILTKTNNTELPIDIILTKTNIKSNVINKQYAKTSVVIKSGIITSGIKSTNSSNSLQTFGLKSTQNPKYLFNPTLNKPVFTSYNINTSPSISTNSNVHVSNIIDFKLTNNISYNIPSNNLIKYNLTSVSYSNNLYKTSPLTIYPLTFTELFDEQFSFGVYEDNGTFDTSELALQAAIDLGYINPITYQLSTGKYIWLDGNLNCEIVLPPIHNPNDERLFLHGYRQGG